VPNPVVTADIEARFRALTDAEETTAQALIDDAWAVLLMMVPDIEARMTAGSTSTEAVVFVMSAMVLRVLRNPNGVRSWSVDDYSETRDSSLAAGSLYASPEEIRLLTGRASSTRSGAFSVAPAAEPCPAPGSEQELIDYLHYGNYSRYGWYR
jgi:hypothetical protein